MVKFLAWENDTVRLFDASTTAITEVRKVTLSTEDSLHSIEQIVWLGTEIFVRYDEDRIGRITEQGFEPLPAVPMSKWRKKAPAGLEAVHFQWTLEVTKKGAWLGHCRWGAQDNHDQDECEHWEHVRVFPGKPVKMEPDNDPPPALPAITPTRTTTSTFEDDLATILRCSHDGKTIEIPAADADNRAYGVSDDLEWLSADPAVFVVTKLSEGDPTTESTSVFENCKETPFSKAARGPHGVFALSGEGVATSVRRDGREIGTIDEPQVVFAR